MSAIVAALATNPLQAYSVIAKFILLFSFLPDNEERIAQIARHTFTDRTKNTLFPAAQCIQG